VPATYPTGCLPTPEPCDTWPSVPPSVVSVPSVAVSSAASSPGSATVHPAEDYVTAGYLPSVTSVPTPMFPGTGIQSQAISCLDNTKPEYDEIDSGKPPHLDDIHHWKHDGLSYFPPVGERGYCATTVPPPSSASYMAPQPWTMYPTPFYQQPSQATGI